MAGKQLLLHDSHLICTCFQRPLSNTLLGTATHKPKKENFIRILLPLIDYSAQHLKAQAEEREISGAPRSVLLRSCRGRLGQALGDQVLALSHAHAGIVRGLGNMLQELQSAACANSPTDSV